MLSRPRTIEAFTISSGATSAQVLNVGATLMELSIEMTNETRPVTIGLGDALAYSDNPHYLGVVAGRCANRIRDGHCEIEGQTFQLDRNENQQTHLHGGSQGFSTRYWDVTGRTESSIALSYFSPDGEQGYPGNLTATCLYELYPDRRIRITLTAQADQPTLVNLAAHSYFNLLPGSSTLDHAFMVQADHYTPVGGNLIPDGRILSVDDTCFDFRTSRTIGSLRSESPLGYDHNFVLAMSPRKDSCFAARLISPTGDLAMELHTTEPGLQFYDGQKLVAKAPGRSDLKPFDGLCLEPQRFPDAVHHPNFASSLLQPGQTYRQVTEYRFLVP